MHHITFRERERLSHKPSHALTDDVVEAFNMASLPLTFARGLMLLIRQHLLVGFPKVAVKQAALVPLRNALPQKRTGRFAAVANGIGNNLPGAAALS